MNRLALIHYAADNSDRLKWNREARENDKATRELDDLFVSIMLATKPGVTLCQRF